MNDLTNPYQLHPMIKDVIAEQRPDWKTDNIEDLRLHNCFGMDGKLEKRTSLVISCSEDAHDAIELEKLSMRALFRGTFNPGELGDTEDIKYMYVIENVESNWINSVSMGLFQVPRDREMEEIYSLLRRRPDAIKNFNNPLYAYIWQLFAFAAIKVEMSEAEFSSILSRLTRSARTFCTSVSSANMYAQLLPLYKSTNTKIL